MQYKREGTNGKRQLESPVEREDKKNKKDTDEETERKREEEKLLLKFSSSRRVVRTPPRNGKERKEEEIVGRKEVTAQEDKGDRTGTKEKVGKKKEGEIQDSEEDSEEDDNTSIETDGGIGADQDVGTRQKGWERKMEDENFSQRD